MSLPVASPSQNRSSELTLTQEGRGRRLNEREGAPAYILSAYDHAGTHHLNRRVCVTALVSFAF